MITVEKLEKGTYFDDAFKISFRYDPTTVAKVKELAERRYLPEDRAWEIPAHELPALIEKVGLSNIKSEEAVVQALNTKEIEDKREATHERLKGIKPVRYFDFKTAPLPHQIEAFNYGMEKNSLLIGDEQGLGKTKESIDICVARKKELIKTLIVCGVNSVKYNWEKEIQIHSNEGCVMVDGKTMDVRVQQLNDWYRGSSYFGVINIESLRNEKIQDALYLGIKDGYIGAIIVDEIHKAKNGGSQQGKALRFLKAPVKIGLSGTPMNKAEDLWNILTWLGVERRSFYSFRNAYCTMGGFGGYKVIGYKNLDSLNAELNTVMLRRKKEEVLDLPPKLYSTEYVELTTAQKKQYRDIKNGIVADMENILASVNPLNCTLRLRQLTSGNPNLTDDSPKLDRIKEMLEEEIIPNGHKAIIFSQWSTIAKDLGIELSEYDPIVITGEVPPEQRQRLVDNFQTNPHCKVAIGTIGAMGTGLTLNKASYVFFMDKAWNSGDNAQAEDRAHRIGTVGAVNVISMVAKGTIDEAVEDYLLENKDLIDRVVDGKGSKQDIKTILTLIAKELNDAGYRNTVGKPWKPMDIPKFVYDCKNVGTMIINKERHDFESKQTIKLPKEEWVYVENALPPIVTQEEWDLICKIHEERVIATGSDRRGKKTSGYSFSGKLVCGICGAPYWRKQRVSKDEYWVCSTKQTKGRRTRKRDSTMGKAGEINPLGCDNENISYNSLMEIMGVVSERLQANTDTIKQDMINWLTKLRKQLLEANGGHTEADLQRELSRKSKLLDAYLDGILNKQEYQKKAEELDERIIQLKTETEKNKANSGDIAEIDKVLANIDEEVARYVDGNEKLKVEYLLEHLEQVQIFPDKVIVIVPILSEGIVVEKTQYVSREKCSKIHTENMIHYLEDYMYCTRKLGLYVQLVA